VGLGRHWPRLMQLGVDSLSDLLDPDVCSDAQLRTEVRLGAWAKWQGGLWLLSAVSEGRTEKAFSWRGWEL